MDHRNRLSNEIADYLKGEILSGFPSIPYLAGRYFISVSKLMRDFKTTFNTSPYLYFRQQQMEFAHRYLTETGCSKKQIAMMLGFSNPANFTSCYKRYLANVKEQPPGYLSSWQEDEQHKILIELMPLAVAMFDLNLNYLIVSGQFLKNFHFEGLDLKGRSMFDFFPGSMAELEVIRNGYLTHGISFFDGDSIFRLSFDHRQYKCESKVWQTEANGPGGLIIYYFKNFDN